MCAPGGVVVARPVNLIGVLGLVHRHVTSSLCASVFAELRTTERARKWTLEAMVAFWLAVVTRAPPSLRSALEECADDHAALGFESATSSFFERAQSLNWEFFDEVFRRFVGSLAPGCAAVFEPRLRARLADFPEVWVVDGSGLDRVAKRLKAVRDVGEVVLPGSVVACYDLFRGIPRVLEYSEALLHGEAGRLEKLLGRVPGGTLLVADRGYCSVELFRAVEAAGVHAVVRMRNTYTVTVEQELGSHEQDGCAVTDRLVTLGRGEGALLIRQITKELPGGRVLRLLTTVLDPGRLPALAALDVYRGRWTVERMFHDLKRVLNLHRFYAANTNAVGMQLFASAIVYAALRATQAQIAVEHEVAAEDLSPARLFPRAAAAHVKLTEALQVFELIRETNPDTELREPDWAAAGLCTVPLESLLVRRRKDTRRRREYSPLRRRSRPLSDFEKRRPG